MTRDELAEILGAHRRWLKNDGGERAVLRGADLRGADLTDADLRGADLRDADLTDAVLRGAVLRGADLRGADLRGADLRGANLRGAFLTGADLRGADLTGAVLTDADLRGAVLRGADLRGADLTDADLTDAVLRGADLRGADLTDADLRKIPVVPLLHTRILQAIEDGGHLDMAAWHTCETTHCRAGWAIVLAGEAGAKLENEVGPAAAGALISVASCPELEGRVPNFYASDEDALADIRRLADMEAAQ